MKEVSPETLRLYCANDCIITSRIAESQDEALSRIHNGQRLHALLTELQYIADEMTWRGIRVDRELLAREREVLVAERAVALGEVQEIARRVGFGDINPRSGDQLRRLVYDYLHATPTVFSKTTGNPSLNEEACTGLLSPDNPILTAIALALLKARKAETLIGTHIDGLSIDPNGVVHPLWRPGGARTARWTGSAPNPMSVPKASEEPVYENGRPVINPDGTLKRQITHGGLRNLYIPHRPGHYIVEADYKQVELLIVANLSGDRPYLDAFARGDDLHAMTAWMMFRKAVQPNPIKRAHVSTKEATLAKGCAFGFAYGIEAEKLWKALLPFLPTFTLAEAAYTLEKFREAHPQMVEWQKAIAREVYRNRGFVDEPVSGRRRIFWEPSPKLPEAYNHKVQPVVSELLNRALPRVAERLRWPEEGILFQYHDALILDGPDPLRLAEILVEEMSTIEVRLGGRLVSFPVDVSVGHRWGSLKSKMTMDEIAALPKGT